jgi:hypothetical protein
MNPIPPKEIDNQPTPPFAESQHTYHCYQPQPQPQQTSSFNYGDSQRRDSRFDTQSDSSSPEREAWTFPPAPVIEQPPNNFRTNTNSPPNAQTNEINSIDELTIKRLRNTESAQRYSITTNIRSRQRKRDEMEDLQRENAVLVNDLASLKRRYDAIEQVINKNKLTKSCREWPSTSHCTK